MSGAETKSFDKPDQEFKEFDNADMYHVNVGGPVSYTHLTLPTTPYV